MRLHDYPLPGGGKVEQSALDNIFTRTRDAAYAIIQRKHATYYAIGLGLLAIAEAVLRDQRTVHTVSTPLTGQHGVTDMALSLPVVVGRDGAAEVLPLRLDETEERQFQHSANTLKEMLRKVES